MADLSNYKIFKNTRFQVLTDTGFQDFEGIMQGDNPQKIKITFSDDQFLVCTPKHKLIMSDKSIRFACDVIVDDTVFDGTVITNIETFENQEKVYELLHVHGGHTYFTNGKLTKNCIIIDEMAFIPHNFMEEFWRSTIPIVSSSKKSKIFSVSTPNGTGNQFYKVYSTAERNEDKDWKAERIDWWEVPGRDESWKRKTIASLGSLEAFNQEFGNEFISTGESAINAELITKYRKEAIEPKIILKENTYKIWEKAQPNRIYVMGCDVGEGIGSTASTVQVLDLTDLTRIKQVACYRDQYINPYSFSKILYEIAGQWGSPYIFMERNNVGSGVLDNLYNVFKYEKIANHVPNSDKINYERLGIYSHTNTKLDAVTNMRYWLNELGAVDIYDIITIQEFETFVRYPNGTWKKKQGEDLFDDMVLALAWGLYALKNEMCERYYEIEKYDERGKPLKIKKSLYDEEEFFGSQSLMKNFNDSDPLPAYVGFYDEGKSDLESLAEEGWVFHQ